MDSLKLLCQCISPVKNSEDLLSATNTQDFDWESVIYCSGGHLVTPALWFSLKKKGILPLLNQEAKNYLELIYDLNLTRNENITKQLLTLLPDLNAAGIEPLLLKGVASLFGDLYESPGIRVLGDMDILLPEEKLTIATKILLDHGYSYTPGLHQEIVKEHRHLPAFVNDDYPVAIEIHRYPVAQKYTGWVNYESAYKGSSKILLGAGTVVLPSPEFRLLHNFCHCQLGDRAYKIGYINARQMLEWVTLRDKYEKEFDWVSIQERVAKNDSIASWGGYFLAVERYFSQAMIPNTEVPLLARFFMLRQQWGVKYTWYWRINSILDQMLFFTEEAFSMLFFNFQRGPQHFVKALKFIFSRFFSINWYKNKVFKPKN
ncbi:MAG: nucleotidyltransferase family protein [Methylococcaceae bacterium]